MTKPKELKDDLGGREKRRELLRQLNGSRAGKRIPGYTDYVKRMTELDAFMEECSAKNAYGASKPLNAAAREKLLKSIRETAVAGEVYLQNALEAKGAGEIADLRKGAPGPGPVGGEAGFCGKAPRQSAGRHQKRPQIL